MREICTTDSTASPSKDKEEAFSWLFVSDNTRQAFEILNYVVLMNLVCLFGTVANSINIVILVKQGLNTTINISLLALAVSDLCSLITAQWLAAWVNPFSAKTTLPVDPEEMPYLTGGWPHACFALITCWITLFITLERALCIVIPLKVKRIITPNRARVLVCLIYILVLITLIPEYSTIYLGWRSNIYNNRTVLGLITRGDNDKYTGLVYYIHVVLGEISFQAVILLTCLIIIQLKRKAQWRLQSTRDTEQSQAISARERKTAIMVAMIASILIACFTPTNTLSLIVVFVPEFNIGARYYNLYAVCWSFAFLLEAVNSSVNIICYYKMSSKYRQTMHGLCASSKMKK